MSWRLRRPATRATGPRGPGGRVRWALVASLAVHGALGWLLLGKPMPRLATLPDVVEVSFEVDETGGEPAASPAGEGSAQAAGVASPARAAPRTGGAARLGATAARAEADAMPATSGDGATPAANGEGPVAKVSAAGDAAAGAADRLSTFRPAHPDLLGAGKGPTPDEKPRDLLASPLAKAPAGPRDLPRVLRGSGGVTARVGEDGSIHFGGPKDVVLNDSPFQKVGEGAGVGLGGQLDVTDQVMKLAGQDPYASAKRALADETREQRLCMARRYQGERQKQELWNLAAKVRRLAGRPDLSAVERRALVFDIWDECNEETESGPDYGAMARATILAVVREVFPAGSDRAYQPGELLALNQRRSSRQRFSPYDPIPHSERGRGRHPDAGAPSECPVQ